MSDTSRGRPRLPDARRQKVGFKASVQEAERIAEIARQNGQTVAEFIREAVSEAAADCSDVQVFRVSN